jgi:PAS domain S-box-containing protein
MSKEDAILVIDDEEGMRNFLSDILGEDYAVFTAPDGREGINRLQEDSFRAAIVDIKMPGMDGLQVLKHIKEAWPEVEVVMLTAYASLDSALDAVRLGAYDYVVKPFRGADIKRVLANAVKKHRLVAENRKLLDELKGVNAKMSEKNCELTSMALQLEESNLRLREAMHRVERSKADLEERVAERTEKLQEMVTANLELEGKYRSLVENSPSGIYLAQDGRIVLTNPAFLKIFDYSHLDEVEGIPLQALVAPSDREAMAELAAEILTKKGSPIRYEFKGLRRDGSTVDIGASATILVIGSRTFIQGILRDITEDKRASAELKKAQEMLMLSERLAAIGQLAARVAHEIRNPLGAISNSIGILKRDLRLSGDDLRLMEVVIKESMRLNRIVTDLLSFARPQGLSLSLADLREVVDDTLFLLRQDSRLIPGVRLTVSCPNPIPLLLLDADRIKNVLLNLLINSVEAMPSGGAVEVKMAECELRGERGVEVSVSDTGVGIEPENVGRLFEPFYTTKPGGTGLGLATVYRVVSEHGGTVDVRSQPGAGTTFSLKLPLKGGGKVG